MQEVGDIGPNRARYNDWRPLNVPTLDAFAPTLPVSVVVPYFEAREKLARTLAALERQTYPRHLFEVVIVDDGSTPPLAPPPSPLDVRVVRREGSGFKAAAARNAGVEAAAHSILVFLDCDVLPEAEFLAAHARWHHVVSDVLTVGWCSYIDVDDIAPAAIRDRPGSLEELFSGREFDRSWVEKFIHKTTGLTIHHHDVFQAVTGIFSIGRAFYESFGGFDESFVRYGFEDTEFGYRAYASGALLAPVGKTFTWHQGRWQPNRTRNKIVDIKLQRAKVAHLIPHRRYRSPAPGRMFTVPRHVVTILAGDQSGHVIAEDVDALLADPAGDLAVRIELAAESWPHRAHWLRERYDPDPRVSIATGNAALDDFPFAVSHVWVSAGACERGLVQRLQTALGAGAAARVVLSDASVATIAHTWALHRSRRTGLPIERFGDVVTIFPGGRAARFLKWLTPRVPKRGLWSLALRWRGGAGHAVAESSTEENSATPAPDGNLIYRGRLLPGNVDIMPKCNVVLTNRQ